VKRPSFFILGAAKCGTTSLQGYLSRHPEVYMSDPKEPHFFEAEYEKGFDFYWQRYFSGWQGERAIGEARHRNLFLPFVAPRIAESVPDAKLLIILRNPVDRCYSHWWHWFSRGVESRSFDDALEADLKRIDAGIDFEGDEGARQWTRNFDHSVGRNEFTCYVDSGYFSRQISRYMALFPAEQLKVLFLEDFKGGADEALSDVWPFLGVDPDFVLPPTSAKNQAGSLLNYRLSRFVKAIKVSGLLPRRVKDRVKRIANRVGTKRPSLSPSTRRDLVEHYRPYNLELEKLTGRDLSHWTAQADD